jgi:plastocyanin
MLIAISIGLSFFFGFDRGTEITVRITETGFSPKAVTVTTGGDIRWINETNKPHVLQSDALCTRNQECFSTRAIEPKQSAVLNITSDFNAGTYPYYSISAQGMEASITVLAGTSGTPATAANTATQQHLAQAVPFDGASPGSTASAGTGQSSATDSRMGTMAFAIPPADEDGFVDVTSVLTENDNSAPQGQYPAADQSVGAASSESARQPSSRTTQLPVNPYTVGSTRAHPFDAEGKPVTAGGNASSTGTLHGGAPRPLSQPETGPALWITLFGSFGLLFLVTRNLLQRAHIE